jgi:hypothetical protein
MRKLWKNIVLCLVVVSIFVMPISAVRNEMETRKWSCVGGLDQLDQSQTVADSDLHVHAYGLAQGFKPSLSTLTRFQVYISTSFSISGWEYEWYRFSIRKDSLTGTDIVTRTFHSSSLTMGQTGWFEISVNPTVTVSPATPYYIVIYGMDLLNTNGAEVSWWYSLANTYVNGGGYANSGAGFWLPLMGGGDFCFKTYGGGGGGNNPPNTPSTPSGPSTGNPGVSYNYYTSAIDPDGDQVSYQFDWGDGTQSTWSPYYTSGSTAGTDHSWPSGTYQVKARAKDTHGAYSGWSSPRTVTIGGGGNSPPNTPNTPSGPTTGTPGATYTYSTSTIDPDGDQVKYYFDWDDGTGDWTSYASSGSTQSASHSWSSGGTYQVKVKAQDDNGADSSYSSTLTVTITSTNSAPNKPNRPSGSTAGKVGKSYSYTSSTNDPDGDKVYYNFSWGDGTYSGWIGPYDSGLVVTASHAWSTEGTLSIQVKAKDEHGTESVWSDPLTISMPKNKIVNINPLFLQVLENHPHLFPILRQILLYLG